MIIAQITDTHIVPKGQDWLNKPETDVNNRLKLVIGHINQLDPKPDVVLFTGDTVEKGSQEAYQHLREILKPLTMPVYIIPGNHDDRQEMQTAFSDQAYFPQEGFIHYVIEDYPVRLIGLDTNVPHKDYGSLCHERFHWLEKNLKANPSKPTLIFMHHHPMKVGQKACDSMICLVEGDLEKLIQTSPHVLGILVGHYHKACTTVYGGKICFLGPSTAPTYYFSRQEDMHVTAIDLVNPSFSLHRWMGGFQMVSECIQAIGPDKRLPHK